MFLHAVLFVASPAAAEPVRVGDGWSPVADPRDLAPADLVWLPMGDGPAAVVGGDAVPQGRWDDAVGIVFDGQYVGCTGTLIGPEVVLTAGHCVDGLNVTHVVVGSKNSATNQGEVVAVDEVHEYPNSQQTLDIAVLTLRSPSTYPPREVAIECILDDHLFDGAEVQIVGFGATTVRGNDQNTRLNEVRTEIVDADCSERRVNGMASGCVPSVNPGGELAAGGGGVDACFGDSGGPLYLLTERGDYVVGVTSRALAGASAQYPCRDGGIWVRPDAAIDWVEDRVGGLEISYPSCNEAPQVEVDDIVTQRGVAGTTRVAVQDPDGPENQATVRVVSRPRHGDVEVDGLELVYTPDAGYTGDDRFTVEVTDAGRPGMPRTGGPLSVEADVNVEVRASGGGGGGNGWDSPGTRTEPGAEAPTGTTALATGCTCATPSAAGGVSWLIGGVVGLLAVRRRR